MPQKSPVQRQEPQGVPLPPETEKGPKQARKSGGLSAEINHPIPPAQTRQRKRTIKAALAKLDGVKMSPSQRRECREKIEQARQPGREADRLIQWIQSQASKTGEDQPDLSDVLELHVKLTRRDGGVWPPQSIMLADLERAVIDGLDRETFDNAAAGIWSLPQALPASFRKVEGR